MNDKEKTELQNLLDSLRADIIQMRDLGPGPKRDSLVEDCKDKLQQFKTDLFDKLKPDDQSTINMIMPNWESDLDQLNDPDPIISKQAMNGIVSNYNLCNDYLYKYTR